MIAETTITIARPPEEVFAFVADPRNDPLWCDRVHAVEPVGKGEFRVMHKPLRMQPRPYELRMRLLESDPPRRLRWDETDRDGTLIVEYELSATPEGTLFRQRSDLSGLSRRVRFFARRTIPRHIAEQARALKRCLEQPRS